MIFRWKWSACMVGRSGSGKTTNLCKMLQKPSIWPDDVKNIFWTNPQGIKLKDMDQCFVDLENYCNKNSINLLYIDFDQATLRCENNDWPEYSIIIFDDVREEIVKKNEGLMTQMTANNNHLNLITIIVVQSLFIPNFKILRDQCRYLMLSKYINDYQSLKSFLKKILCVNETIINIVIYHYENMFTVKNLSDKPVCIIDVFSKEEFNKAFLIWLFSDHTLYTAKLETY